MVGELAPPNPAGPSEPGICGCCGANNGQSSRDWASDPILFTADSAHRFRLEAYQAHVRPARRHVACLGVHQASNMSICLRESPSISSSSPSLRCSAGLVKNGGRLAGAMGGGSASSPSL